MERRAAVTDFSANILIAAASEPIGGVVRTLHRDDRLEAGQGVVWFPIDAVVRAQTSDGLLEGWEDYRGAVGLTELIRDQGSDTVWAVERAGRVLSLSADQVKGLLERSSGFRQVVMKWLADAEHAARRRAAFNLTAPAAERIRRVVDFVLKIHNDEALLIQGQLAAYTGIQRTTVNAIMRDLNAQGHVSYKRGRIRRCDNAIRAEVEPATADNSTWL